MICATKTTRQRRIKHPKTVTTSLDWIGSHIGHQSCFNYFTIEYLQEKYDILRKQFIDNEKEKGVPYSTCPVCHFDSMKELGIVGNSGRGSSDVLKVQKCQVCDFQKNVFYIKCPLCFHGSILMGEDEFVCECCGHVSSMILHY